MIQENSERDSFASDTPCSKPMRTKSPYEKNGVTSKKSKGSPEQMHNFSTASAKDNNYSNVISSSSVQRKHPD